MAPGDIELRPVDFVTIGTVGPRGQRVFHLQAGGEGRVISLIIEKEQARALGEAIRELLADIAERFPQLGEDGEEGTETPDMALREPIEPLFRVSQMGLGFEESSGLIILQALELALEEEAQEAADAGPGVVRFWCSHAQMRALGSQADRCVQAGRANPRQNGRINHYWT